MKNTTRRLVCYLCKQSKPLTVDYYYKNKSKSSGFSAECRECHKKHSQARRTKRRIDFVASKGNLCAHCGVKNNNHMFFDIDHIIPLHNRSVPRTLRDYDKDKVQVLCPNCHRVKTMNEMNWGKYEKI